MRNYDPLSKKETCKPGGSLDHLNKSMSDLLTMDIIYIKNRGMSVPSLAGTKKHSQVIEIECLQFPSSAISLCSPCGGDWEISNSILSKCLVSSDATQTRPQPDYLHPLPYDENSKFRGFVSHRLFMSPFNTIANRGTVRRLKERGLQRFTWANRK